MASTIASSTSSVVISSIRSQSAIITSQPPYSFSVKLTPKNYVAWRAQFERLLNSHNLMNYVTGDNPAQIENSTSHELEPNSAYRQWLNKDQTVLSWLFTSFTEGIFTYIVGLKISHSV